MENDKPVEFSGVLDDLGSMKDVETKYPVLQAGLYSMKIKSFKKSDKPNATTGKPQSMLLVELATTEVAKSTNDDAPPVNPGHVITDRIILTPVGGLTADMIKQKLARVMECYLGHHDGAFNTNDLIGATGTVQIAIRPEREDNGKTYEESNEVKKYVPKG